MASDNIALAPFVHASVWREFAGDNIVNAYVNNSGSSFNFAVNSDRVGTFGQIGAGVQFKLLDFGLLGFIRGDLRFGNALNGQAVNIGFRKQF
jgi:outer membrane autotransporter protein